MIVPPKIRFSTTHNIVVVEKAAVCATIFVLAVLQRTNDPNSSLEKFSFAFYSFVSGCFLLLFIKHFLKLKSHRINYWYSGFLLLIVSSILWSTSYYSTMKQASFLVVSSMYAYYLYLRFDMRVFLNVILTGLTIVIVTSIVLILVFPSKSIHVFGVHEGAWKGIYFHKSGLGKEVVIAAIIGLFSLKKPLNLLYFLVCVFITYKAQSMISVICLVISVGYYYYSTTVQKIRQLKNFRLWLFALIFLLFSLIVYINLPYFLSFINKDPTFNGRTTIWLFSLYSIIQKPLLGYGYSAFWEDDKLSNYIGWDMPHAHNHFLDVALDVGLVGLVIFTVVLFRFFRRTVSFGRIQKDLSDIAFISVLCILVISCTENSIHQPFSLVWIYFSCMLFFLDNCTTDTSNLVDKDNYQ